MYVSIESVYLLILERNVLLCAHHLLLHGCVGVLLSVLNAGYPGQGVPGWGGGGF